MNKFIKGCFELDKNVTDLVSYEEKKKVGLDRLIDWANGMEIGLKFGISDDNTYLCEYKIICKTASLCKGILSELKYELKSVFPKAKSSWQASGNILY